MSQSATNCFVVTFRYQEEGLTDLAKLTGLDQEDVQRLAQGFGQLALGKQPEVAICACKDYLQRLHTDT